MSNATDSIFEVETLEHRILLAGNIRVTSRGDDITIRGDGRSNYVEIARETTDQNSDGDIDDLVIRGITDTNGDSTGIRDGRDILSQIVLDANDGTFAGKLSVSLGGGNDFISFRDVTIDGDFKFTPEAAVTRSASSTPPPTATLACVPVEAVTS